jgi:hypothetical protein
MKKITLIALSVLSTSFGFSQITNPAPYCQVAFNNNYNMLKDFKIGTTVITDFGAMQNFGQTGGSYKYYNTQVLPTLNQGTSYNFSLGVWGVFDGEPMYFAVYIDYNRNNVFDTNELVMQNAGTTNAALPLFNGSLVNITKMITIPTTALSGVTRLRIIRGQKYTGSIYAYDNTYSLAPCATLNTNGNTYGNSVDYNVTIGTLGTHSFSEVNGLSIYPNPSKNYFFLNNDLNLEITSLVMYNQLGQKVKVLNPTDAKHTIDDLQDGIYFVKVVDSENNNYNTRLLISN